MAGRRHRQEYDSFPYGSRAKMAGRKKKNDPAGAWAPRWYDHGRTVWNPSNSTRSHGFCKALGKRLSTNGVGQRKAQHESRC
ncbi:MAG: hypothetical protein ACLTMP_10680 [Eggerthella lenta]